MVRLMPAVFLVLAFALAFGMVSASGMSEVIGVESPGGSDLYDTAEDVGSEGEDIEFDPEAGGGDSLLGSSIATVSGVIEIFHLVLVFPTALQMLGFPSWAASPVGIVMQLLLVIGVYQIVRGDRVR